MMDVRTISESERQRIARDYGVEAVTNRVTVCPPRTYALDATHTESWMEKAASSHRMRARQWKFEHAGTEKAKRRAVQETGGEHDDAVADLTKKGLSASQIAEKLKISRTTVFAARRRTGAVGMGGHKRLEIDAQRVKEMNDAGMSQKKIAQKLQCSESVVRKCVQEMGIEIAANKRAREYADRDAEILKLTREGVTIDKLCQMFSVQSRAIERAIKRAAKREKS